MTRRGFLAATAAAALAPGCGYSIRPPFDRGVQTVYVPIIKSATFRREINFQLTQLLIDEIQRRTPYTVVGSPEGADSTLEGVITWTDKNVGVENPNNLPRQVNGQIMVQVKWIDNRTRDETTMDLPPVPVQDFAPYFPELGETTQLGYYKVMKKMASQIVSMMEERWDERGNLRNPTPGGGAVYDLSRSDPGAIRTR